MKEARQVPVGDTVQGVHRRDQVGQVDLSGSITKSHVSLKAAAQAPGLNSISHIQVEPVPSQGRRHSEQQTGRETTPRLGSQLHGAPDEAAIPAQTSRRSHTVGQTASWMWSARHWCCHAAARLGNPEKPSKIVLSLDALTETPKDDPQAFTVHQPVRCFAPREPLSALCLTCGAPGCRQPKYSSHKRKLEQNFQNESSSTHQQAQEASSTIRRA